MTKLYDLASTILEQKLSQIQGVGQVFVGGGATPSVRVEVDPTKLESFGLTLANVQSVLSLQNSHEPRGQISDNGVTADILTNDQISQGRPVQAADRGLPQRQAVRLSDVADVTIRRRTCARPATSTATGGPHHHLPPAGRQHHRDGRPHPGATAVSEGALPAGHRHHHRSRPHHHHPRLGA